MTGAGIGVLVAEDNRDLCAAVCELIATEPDMHVTATAERVSQLLDVVATTPAQVLVLDLDLAGESSVPALNAFRAAHPERAIVVYSGHDRRSLEGVLAQVGHCEYVTKTGDALDLLDAIRRGASNTACNSASNTATDAGENSAGNAAGAET